MRKHRFAALLLALLLTAAVFPASAAEPAQAVLELSCEWLESGQAKVTVSKTNDAPLAGYSLCLRYDSEKLVYAAHEFAMIAKPSIEPSPLEGGEYIDTQFGIGNSYITFVAVSTSETKAIGALFSVTFDVPGAPGDASTVFLLPAECDITNQRLQTVLVNTDESVLSLAVTARGIGLSPHGNSLEISDGVLSGSLGVAIANSTDAALGGRLVLALYDSNGKMVYLKSKEVAQAAEAGESYTFESISLPVAGALTYRAILISDLKPVCAALSGTISILP